MNTKGNDMADIAAARQPESYTDGLGELIRAKRLYTGLSRDGMARQLDMRVNSYQRIESGTRPCPPGLIDLIDDVLDRFDSEVSETIATASKMVTDNGGANFTVVNIVLSSRPEDEWHRAVMGRAAVEGGNIVPSTTGEVTVAE